MYADEVVCYCAEVARGNAELVRADVDHDLPMATHTPLLWAFLVRAVPPLLCTRASVAL